MSVTKIAAIAVAALMLPILFIAAATGVLASVVTPRAPSQGLDYGCVPTSDGHAGVAGYQPDQITNAATIVAVGKQLSIPAQGWVVAIAAAITESGLRNLDYGDRDSLGLFQQRPSQGWGTPAQILNPSYSATQFYRHLLAVANWQHMTVNDAAQAVQRSATPSAYAAHEPAARALVNAVQSTTCTTFNRPASTRPPTSGVAGTDERRGTFKTAVSRISLATTPGSPGRSFDKRANPGQTPRPSMISHYLATSVSLVTGAGRR